MGGVARRAASAPGHWKLIPGRIQALAEGPAVLKTALHSVTNRGVTLVSVHSAVRR